ncbi:MAG TPA: MBL fold metallo-hydrolase [Candidatus Binatia bacterium]|nr:MBL fold metallo-hydrolase [Candidatus Binatia bacterium]
MESTITEIAPDIYRISTFHEGYKMQFNQFLVKDDEPLLVHTAFRKMFPVTRDAVARVIDPASVRWIGFSHFESDECGALNDWFRVAPRARAVCSFVGKVVMLDDFADGEVRALADGETLEIGRHRIEFLSTPHVPHCWDAGLFFDGTERTLFCSDLFFHAGDPPPMNDSDVVTPARESIIHGMAGPMRHDMPFTPYTESTLERLASLAPRTLALMHGSTFTGDGGSAIRALARVIGDTLGPHPAR